MAFPWMSGCPGLDAGHRGGDPGRTAAGAPRCQRTVGGVFGEVGGAANDAPRPAARRAIASVGEVGGAFALCWRPGFERPPQTGHDPGDGEFHGPAGVVWWANSGDDRRPVVAARRATAGRVFFVMPLSLGVVWAINFFVVLPVISPGFVHLLPLAVSLASKLAFGLAAAFACRNFAGPRDNTVMHLAPDRRQTAIGSVVQ
jgi:hypothetical protein